jgi:hypothetical protein
MARENTISLGTWSGRSHSDLDFMHSNNYAGTSLQAFRFKLWWSIFKNGCLRLLACGQIVTVGNPFSSLFTFPKIPKFVLFLYLNK